MNNSSSETWHDRVRDTTFNQEKSFARNQNECFKQLFTYAQESMKEKGRHFSELDKVCMGNGRWAEDD